MSVALDIEGTSRPRARIALRAGQVATVGRSPWADVSLPSEPDLAEEHFRIDCRHDGCRVESLGGTLLRNGVKTSATTLVDGDSLTAGSVQFRVRLFGLTQSRTQVDRMPSLFGTIRTPDDEFTTILDRAGLSPDGRTAIIMGDRLDTFDSLLASGLTKDACRFAVACLPRAAATEWAVLRLRGAGLSLEEQRQLSAAVQGAQDALSAEEIDGRMAAHPMNSPAAWLWKAARWAGGSLSGPGLPPVPPAPHLFAVAVSVALSLGAARQRPDPLPEWIATVRERIANITEQANTEP
ncbi:MAG: FHA domain-containing protein [Planctomycetaceae bacterium]